MGTAAVRTAPFGHTCAGSLQVSKAQVRMQSLRKTGFGVISPRHWAEAFPLLSLTSEGHYVP